MSSRTEILERVRAGLGGKAPAAARRALAEAHLAALARGPQPARVADLAARFRAKAELLASSVDVVDGWSQGPAAVAGYLAAHGLGQDLVVSAEVAGLAWSAWGLRPAVRGAVDADGVGVTGCFCAIAESGTLMLASGAGTPASVSLLPETHIALVPVSRMVATLEDAFCLWRQERGPLPRAVNFVSGPSRTGDIEQTIVLGAHGPCRVHIILVRE